ncbi:helix-turn-helix transcriptional regulator [Corynebacterium striatum]|uniref:helix-turn-helix transcriptional regulator n=1 Tax=Corynebacterium striatum TaxID=43770 RepID=UPI003B59321D
MIIPDKPALSLREVAPLLGVSDSTIYAAARDGKLPFPVLKINSRYVVPTKPLLETLGLNDKEVA